MSRLLPDFKDHRITVETAAGQVAINAAVGGAGPPLLLLHGFPQTHAMWHLTAPTLAAHYTVVCADLRGYGDSDTPDSQNGDLYTKRVMAEDQIALMGALGHDRFGVAGHDRGGRVAYRLALDHPEVVDRVAVLDINPTADYYANVDKDFGMKAFHWFFLPQAYDLPERLIGADPAFFLQWMIGRYMGDGEGLAPEAMREYLRYNTRPANIHAMCEDYRAGAHHDDRNDKLDLDAGRKIAAPLLTIWGGRGLAQQSSAPLETWRRWADDVTGFGAPSGHFVPEEAPHDVVRGFLDFFPR